MRIWGLLANGQLFVAVLPKVGGARIAKYVPITKKKVPRLVTGEAQGYPWLAEWHVPRGARQGSWYVARGSFGPVP